MVGIREASKEHSSHIQNQVRDETQEAKPDQPVDFTTDKAGLSRAEPHGDKPWRAPGGPYSERQVRTGEDRRRPGRAEMGTPQPCSGWGPLSGTSAGENKPKPF